MAGMRFKLIAGTFLMALCFTYVAYAQEDSLGADYATDARNARITKLKETYRIVLDETERQRIVMRCVPAQKRLLAIEGRLVASADKRRKIYQGIIDDLNKIRVRLLNQEVDTSSVDLLIATYQEKLEFFNARVQSYDISLEDSVVVDCQDKPDDFRAALEGVRANRKLVADASGELAELTRSDLKTSLERIALKVDQ